VSILQKMFYVIRQAVADTAKRESRQIQLAKRVYVFLAFRPEYMVVLQFWIEWIKRRRDVGNSCKVARLLCLPPYWNPAFKNAIPVRIFAIAFFDLNPDSYAVTVAVGVASNFIASRGPSSPHG
jgi:hypothetical protein